MKSNFGVIALHSADIENLKQLCDKWESENMLLNYMLLKGKNNWVSIFDESFEWGSIDVFIQRTLNDVGGVIFSAEYLMKKFAINCGKRKNV